MQFILSLENKTSGVLWEFFRTTFKSFKFFFILLSFYFNHYESVHSLFLVYFEAEKFQGVDQIKKNFLLILQRLQISVIINFQMQF